MTSWLEIDKNSDFSIHNIPFGIISTKNKKPCVATRIGDYVIDLEQLRKLGLLNIPRNILNQPYLNSFIGLDKKKTNQIRLQLQKWLSDENSPLKKYFNHAFHKIEEVKVHLPIRIGDYTDFYSSLEHATNVGKLFRPDNPLLPNWRHIPIAYHGRSSSIVVSGTDIRRPKGQINAKENETPIFTPSKRLDFELEMAWIIGKNSDLGESITTQRAEEYVFGFVMLNDWSARDIQRWEYQPLGPFLSKNFATSISAWVVTLEALEPFRVKTPQQNPKPLPYIQFEGQKNFDINLEVQLNINEDIETISRTNYKNIYWNINQQIAHHTINGCNLKIGDLMASGTISGFEPNSYGSLLELTEGGKLPIFFKNGVERKFLEDGDAVMMKGFAQKDEIRVGFGEVVGRILPSLP